MTSKEFTSGPFSLKHRRKLLWLLILVTLITVSVMIVPRVATPNPAVDSKLLALRVLLALIMPFSLLNWRSLAIGGWRFIDSIFAGLALSFIISTTFSGRFTYSLLEHWHLGALYLLGWIIYRLKPNLNECNALVHLGGVLGFLAALYGFLTFLGIDILHRFYPFAFSEDEGGRNFIHSFFGNPEYFGGFAAPTAILLIGLALQPRVSTIRRAIWMSGAGFILAVLALSGSRGAFLGFLAGTAILFFGQVGLLTKRMQKATWAISLLSTIALLVGAVILSTPNRLNPRDMRLLQRFGDLLHTQTDSVRERLLFYTSTAAAIPQNFIFGYGPGTYRLEFFDNVRLLVEQDEGAATTILLQSLNRRLAEHTHNDYLEIWFEQGVVGFGLLILLITYASVRFLHTRWHIRKLVQYDAALATPTATYVIIFGSATTLFVNALTSFPLHMPARATLAWTLIGSFFAMDYLIQKRLLIQPAASEEQMPTITEKEK